MAQTWTLTGNLKDLLGTTAGLDFTRLAVWVAPTTDAPLVAKDTGEVRVGKFEPTVAADGSVSFNGLPDTSITGGNGWKPAPFRYRLIVRYRDNTTLAPLQTWESSEFELTSNTTLGAVLNELPPGVSEGLVALFAQYAETAETSAADAQSAQSAAEAAAALAADVSNIDTPDALVKTLVANPASQTAGALSASYVSVNEAAVSIEKFAAARGSVTGNRAAVQAALDHASTAADAQGEVLIPEGIWGIDGWTGAGSNSPGFYGLRLKNGVHLKGAGPRSILRATDRPSGGVQGAFIGNDQSASGASDLWVSDLTIDLVDKISGSAAAGIMIGNPFTNITERGARGVKVRGVRVINSPFLGIQIRGGSSEFEIASCDITDITYIGIQVQNSHHGTIHDNNVQRTGDNCIDLSGENGSEVASATHGVRVSGNVVRNGSNGIFLETTSGCSVVDNVIDDCVNGIIVNKISSIVQGNALVGNLIRDSTTTGVTLANNVLDTAINGNTMRLLAATIGLDVATCYRGAISGNTFYGPKDNTTATGTRFRATSAYFTVAGNSFSFLAKDIDVAGGSFSIRRGLNANANVTTVLADG